MNRLLIVVTRMYAQRGEHNDEFAREWARVEERDKGHLVFWADDAGQALHLLVIHGHHYPDHLGQQERERFKGAIVEGCKSLGLGESPGEAKVGVIFHPPQGWGGSAFRKIEETMPDALPEGWALEFSKNYSSGVQSLTDLAVKCKAGQNFVTEFDRVWVAFGGQATPSPALGGAEPAGAATPATDIDDEVKQFATLRHKIINLLQPIENNLQTWVETEFDAECGREIAEEYADGGARECLSEARALTLGGDDQPANISAVLDAIIAKVGGAPVAAELKKLKGKIRGLFDSDAYRETEKVLGALGGIRSKPEVQLISSDYAPVLVVESERAQAGRVLGRLEGSLREGNVFHDWYASLTANLDESRDAIQTAAAKTRAAGMRGR